MNPSHPVKQGHETKFESHIHSLKTVIPRNPTKGYLMTTYEECHFSQAVFQWFQEPSWARVHGGGLGGGSCVQNIDHMWPFLCGEGGYWWVTQPQDSSESLRYLSIKSSGPDPNQPQSFGGFGHTSGKSWSRSGVQTVILKWSNELWKLWAMPMSSTNLTNITVVG